jgi:hypothetical protein
MLSLSRGPKISQQYPAAAMQLPIVALHF